MVEPRRTWTVRADLGTAMGIGAPQEGFWGLLSAPALDVRLMTALQVLQVLRALRSTKETAS